VVAEDFCEVVGDLVAPVCVGKLKAVSTEHEAGVGILDGNSGGGWGRGRQIEVIVAAEMEADLIDRLGIEGRLQGNLKEVAGGAVG